MIRFHHCCMAHMLMYFNLFGELRTFQIEIAFRFSCSSKYIMFTYTQCSWTKTKVIVFVNSRNTCDSFNRRNWTYFFSFFSTFFFLNSILFINDWAQSTQIAWDFKKSEFSTEYFWFHSWTTSKQKEEIFPPVFMNCANMTNSLDICANFYFFFYFISNAINWITIKLIECHTLFELYQCI